MYLALPPGPQMFRARNREIRAKQWAELKKNLVVEDDGQTRRKVKPRPKRRGQKEPPPPPPPVDPQVRHRSLGWGGN
jgi:hypothetical protein